MRNLTNADGPRLDGFVNKSDLNVGDTLSGSYQGSFTTTGKYGPQTVFRIQTESQLLGINSSTILAPIGELEVGTFVAITYQGMGQNKKGQQLTKYDVVAYDNQAEFEAEGIANTVIVSDEAAVAAPKKAAVGAGRKLPFAK